ncbi:MAG: DUF4295 family protein [Flavobacteriales bacterium]|nr:DUF4295 family protein [Flavobacteriales bacterium]MCB9164834.1 DUF4295 family protein [Flavobacteriales bacterium]MCB9179240.1 DUF4295 family protein [Flavobacteriales bacterium]HNR55905.1 DUF4295 family protein [Flavobacteriales bacterium]HNU55814.1 DUF4295 family protein [Flavobacteriales bacterium]
MAKKTVATLKKEGGKTFTKVIRMMKKEGGRGYSFVEQVVPSDEAEKLITGK